MKISLTGLNHKTAPIDLREKLAFRQEELGAVLAGLKRCEGVLEGLILCTCNRVEVVLSLGSEVQGRAIAEDFLSLHSGIDAGAFRPHLYLHEGEQAVRHIFRVASSLDSMVVGEPQILGQMKSAYALAKANGAVSGLLESVLMRSFAVAKRVRSETDIGQAAVSVSYAAVELAKQIFGSLTNKVVMIVGAGKMSELAVKHLRRAGASRILVTNRTLERAASLASFVEGEVVPYEQFIARLPEADIAITSSAAPHFILTPDNMRRVLELRRNRPVFLIDIAVPRNVDPAVNELDNVFLYDIDDLKKVVLGNLEGRARQAAEAEQIIEEEVSKFASRLKARELSPVIATLQRQLEELRVGELDRLQGRLSTLTPEQLAAVEALTRSIINKVAHGPIAELHRSAAEPDGLQSVEVIRRVFRLEN